MTTGQLIKAARRNAGMTQAELANKLGIPYQSVSQWERDTRKPKYDTVKRIAAALEVEWTELVPEEQQGQTVIDHMKERLSRLNRPQINTELLFSAIDGMTRAQYPELYDEKGILGQLENEPGYKALVKIDEALSKLNQEGQQEAVKRVEELTEIPRYRTEPAPQPPPDPQEGTDTA